MPFTKQPTVSTYDTQRLNILSNPQQRSGSLPQKDFRLVNMLVEFIPSPVKETKQAFVKSRPGYSAVYTVPSGVARGIYFWVVSGVGYTLSVVGSALYVNNTSLATLGTSTGTVGFTEFVDSTGVVKLVMLDGTTGYVFTSPTVAPTAIVDAQFPTPHVPHPIFMDGYLFIAKADSLDIYNSDLDDPAVWTAGNYTSAEMYPDKIVALSKNNNYIYAIGSNSLEYFYDAANVTGSPLQRQAEAVQQFGCVAPSTVVQTEKEVIFVGETANGGHTVWVIDGFKEREISIPAVKNVFLNEGSSLPLARAFCIRASGQKLYIIVLTSRTLVYSFDTSMWSEWSSGATGASNFTCTYATDGANGSCYLLSNTGGSVYGMNETYLNDNGTAFRQEIVTAKFEFDNLNRKFMSRFGLIGDVPDSTGTDNTLTIEWSDDDYQTWSSPRNLSFNNDFPMITQLGVFRRRAFRIRYASPHLLRLEEIEVDINKGLQ